MENKMFGKINFTKNSGIEHYKKEENNSISFEQLTKIVIQNVQENISEKVIHHLYDIYKDSDVSSVYVINEPMFKQYLRETLPEWLRSKK